MWRQLARNSVPWQQWTTDQKEAAHQDYQRALRRQQNTAERMQFWDEDNELFRLLQPYKSEMRDFSTKHSFTWMTGTATVVSNMPPPYPGQYQASHGEKVTWSVDVHLLDDKSSTATGEVLFEIFTRSRQVDLKRVTLSKGRAVYTTVVMPIGKYRVKATYQPLNTGNISSEHEVTLDIV